MSRSGSGLCLAVLALAAAPGVGAQEDVIAPGEERLKLNLGGVLFRAEHAISETIALANRVIPTLV